jgi:hypothetical protein
MLDAAIRGEGERRPQITMACSTKNANLQGAAKAALKRLLKNKRG